MKFMDSSALTSILEGKQIRRDELPAVLQTIREETKQGGLLAAACMLQKRITSQSA